MNPIHYIRDFDRNRLYRSKTFWPVLAFAFPFLACALVWFAKGVYPFGDRCILHMDMYHQYCAFFTEFLRKLRSGESLMYSWNVGLGSDFYSVFVYYLASPLNWLIILCPKDLVIEFMTLLILVKIGASGLTFFLYLRHHYHLVKKNGEYKRTTAAAFLFSSAYALSGFVAAYNWDIMWMDVVALAPLIILGLEIMMKEGRPALYYVTLSLAILSNYYLSIMVCIFLCLWYLITLLDMKKGRIKATGRFILYSLLAGGSGLVMMYPEMKVLAYSGSAGFEWPKTMEWYFNILAEFGRMGTMTEVFCGDGTWPNLYAGAASLLLIGMYLFNTAIPWKKKLAHLALWLFFLLSFANNWMDFIWHGLHFPDSLPGRQSFLFAFLVLVIGFEAYYRRKNNRLWQIALSGTLAMVLVAAGCRLGDAGINGDDVMPVTLVLIAIYSMGFLLEALSPAIQKLWVRRVLAAVVLVELVSNMAVVGLWTTSRTEYKEKDVSYEKLLAIAQADAMDLAGTDDPSAVFYRVEDTGRMSKNDDCLYGYPSTTQFSSLMNINVSHFFQKIYMEGGKNYYCYNGATPLISSMLGVQYYLSEHSNETGKLRTLIAEWDGNYLYRNHYCLPLGFTIAPETAEQWEQNDSTRVDGINALNHILGGSCDLLTAVSADIEVEEGMTTIHIPERGYYFAAKDKSGADSLRIDYEDGNELRYSKTTHTYLLSLGDCDAGDEVTVNNWKDEEIGIRLYRLIPEGLDIAYDSLSQYTLKLEHMDSTHIRGSIDTSDAYGTQRLILSVASEPGWTLKVDGEKRELMSFADTFIAADLTPGSHSIELTYRTPGLVAGGLGSLACLFIFVITRILGTGVQFRENKKRSLTNAGTAVTDSEDDSPKHIASDIS